MSLWTKLPGQAEDDEDEEDLPIAQPAATPDDTDGGPA